MKIILLKDEKNLGKKGDMIEASEGYARNYILPKKIGVEATAKNLNDLKLQKASQEKKAKEQLEAAKELAVKLEASPVVVSIKGGEGGKTFGSVSSKEIAEELQKVHNISVDKKKIDWKEPIKELGTRNVDVKLFEGVVGIVRVNLVAEE